MADLDRAGFIVIFSANGRNSPISAALINVYGRNQAQM